MPSKETKQRSFHLPADQADWLREEAFRTRRTQTDIVREALAARQAGSSSPPAPDEDEGARMQLAEMFIEGRGVDLDLLRNRDRMWQREP